LRNLAKVKETRNSSLFSEFLDLKIFCPEIITRLPNLNLQLQLAKPKVVTSCVSISNTDILILVVYDKPAKISTLEFHNVIQVVSPIKKD
jgi:hypothetical protein